MTLVKRIEKLEQRAAGPGRRLVVGVGVFDPAENERAWQAARAAAGPADELVLVQYVPDWRAGGGDDDRALEAVQ